MAGGGAGILVMTVWASVQPSEVATYRNQLSKQNLLPSASAALHVDFAHGADLRQPISLERQLLSEGPGGLGGEKGRSLLDMVGQGGSEHRTTSSLRSSSRSTAASTRITPAASLDLVMPLRPLSCKCEIDHRRVFTTLKGCDPSW